MGFDTISATLAQTILSFGLEPAHAPFLTKETALLFEVLPPLMNVPLFLGRVRVLSATT